MDNRSEGDILYVFFDNVKYVSILILMDNRSEAQLEQELAAA